MTAQEDGENLVATRPVASLAPEGVQSRYERCATIWDGSTIRDEASTQWHEHRRATGARS